MTVTTEKKDNTCVLLVSGEVDTLTAPALSEAVDAAAPECEKLVIDLGGVEYMSSAGIRSIIMAYQKKGAGNFALRNLTQNVQDVFKMTGFLKILTVE